jgi:hypothetical protein
VARFDRITEFENRLERHCQHPVGEAEGVYTLEGSDCKLGHMEVRLLTDDPPRTLEVIRDIIPPACPYDAGYRNAHTQEPLNSL